jgi:methylmalonyl-CoA mutase N-terminal domain/subunit
MESEIKRILAEISELGGMAEAQRTGWAEEVINREALKIQKQVESGERVLVGVNRYMAAGGGAESVHEVSSNMVRAQIDQLVQFKKSRDANRVGPALRSLREVASRKNVNLFPAAIDAIELGATLGELNGYIRMGFGYPYDDFGAAQPPF